METELSGNNLKPKRLSVVIPNYNHGHYLEERISSILQQLGPEDEFILVDDASTDNSVEIIQKFQDPRLFLYQNKVNKGVAETFLRGVKASKGSFLFGTSADDKLAPHFIETAMNAFAEDPRVALFCSDYATFDPPTSYKIIPRATGLQILSPSDTLKLCRTTAFRVSGHTTIVKMKTFWDYGAMDGKLGPYCDWFLWHTIALQEKIAYLPQVLAYHRLDKNNFSKKHNTAAIRQALLLKLSSKEMAPLNKLFCKSTLLYPFVRKNLTWALKHPCLWRVFAYTICMNTLKRWKLSLAKRIP